jgi:hypothetical protein
VTLRVGSRVQVRCYRVGGEDLLLQRATVTAMGERIITLDDGSRWLVRTLQRQGARATRGCGTFFEPRLVET